jgi:anti-sigma28 factor (negative regulator of flagellin synthesis)
MTLTVPDDVLLTIDSQYSDISVGGLKRALSIVGRNGVVNVKDHFGDLRIDNMFGNVSIANIRGEASIASRSSKVTADNIEGRFALTGQSIDFKGTKLLAGAIIDNHRGKNNVSDVETDVRINSNYGDIQLSNVRGMATITSQYPSKINVERVEGLRANIERGELSINNLGSVIGVSVTGKYAKVTGSGIKGSLIVEGERNTIDVENVEKDVMIRNTYGSVSLDGVKGQLMLTGNNNTINFGNVSGERVDIDQSRSLIKGDFTGSIRKISITNNNGDVEIGVGSSFTGRYTLRNEDGLIQHNFGSSLFSEEATLVREVSGGNSNAQTEIRIVNRNGRLIVRKQ